MGRTILLLFAAALASAQTYPIRMAPAISAGQRFTITASGSKQTKTSAGDGAGNSDELQLSFQGSAEVLAVDRGEPVRIAFTAESFRKTRNGQTVDVVKPGTTVLADSSREHPFSLREGALDKDAEEAFGVLFSAHKPGDPSDDEVFGTRAPQRIGDSWPIDAATAAKSLSALGVSIPDGHFSGATSLIGKDRIGSADCLQLRGELKGDGITVTNRDFPPGVTADQGTVRASFHGCLPVEGAPPSHSGGIDMVLMFRLSVPNGPTLQLTFQQQTESVWTVVGH